jgi:hypothetical protein
VLLLLPPAPAGIADASLRSVAAGCARIETPLLNVSYESFDDDKPPIRPYNPVRLRLTD